VYNIIFLDNNMPNLKGSIITKIIRSFGCNSLIIGVTGDNIDIYDNDFLRNGANIVYKKPFKKEDIKNLYNFYMNNHMQDFINKLIKINENNELFIMNHAV
jgi:CheY-like chemotaxis protein